MRSPKVSWTQNSSLILLKILHITMQITPSCIEILVTYLLGSSIEMHRFKGGGGFRPIILESLIMKYGMKGKARSKNGAKNQNINQKR